MWQGEGGLSFGAKFYKNDYRYSYQLPVLYYRQLHGQQHLLMIMGTFIVGFISCVLFLNLVRRSEACDPMCVSLRFCQSAIESAERDQELHVQSVVTSKQQQTLTTNGGACEGQTCQLQFLVAKSLFCGFNIFVYFPQIGDPLFRPL